MDHCSKSHCTAYVPYQFWTEADPKLICVIQSSLVNYRHELLLENVAGIPILQQHGSADDNVPAFHSRRLSQLISQEGYPSGYVELRGKGHWFDGVMTTTCLQTFYHEVLAKGSAKPELPNHFNVIVASPASLGSRGGIVLDQLICPGQLGKLEVERNSETSSWNIKTSNILRFHFSLPRLVPHCISVDGSQVDIPPSTSLDGLWVLRSEEGSWTVGDLP